MNFGLLIWSYQRPGQLDLLLSSLDKFCPNQFKTYVLYRAEGEFIEGYELCKRYHPTVNFVPETDFCAQTKEILRQHKYMAVSTDDTVATAPFTLKEEYMANVDVFSLRLGFNTVIQDPFSGKKQPALNRFADEGDTIVWDTRYYHPLDNYGFIAGHDLVVYGEKYKALVSGLAFKKANELETKLFYIRDKFCPYIRSFKKSVGVNIPGNNSSGITETDNSLPFEVINRKFVSGKRFRLKEVLEMDVVGCHQLCSLVME